MSRSRTLHRYRQIVRRVFPLVLSVAISLLFLSWTLDSVWRMWPSPGASESHTNEPIKVRSSESRFSSWIVITSVAQPTADVMHMASIPGWKVVVVGDEKTPENWSCPNCVYLSLADQRALGFRLADKLPVHSYTRKNIGYLYAIRHGATVIYDTDDDIKPLDNLTSFHSKPSTSGLVIANSDGQVFNPYPHFGQPTLWPRGYPLEAINEQTPIRKYRLSTDIAPPLIQQGAVKGDPDFDAIFRLTRKGKAAIFNVTFDPVSPPVFLPTRMFSPINSQNTLFLHKAFWALLLPTTTAFRVCDIWRGYWAQRLLWEVGGSLGFPGANARQSRNARSYLSDAQDENQMYFQTDRLLSFLTSWSCPEHLSFFACVERLSVDMASEGFWGKKDAEITQIWLKDLLSVGYQEPKRLFSTSRPCRGRSNSFIGCEKLHMDLVVPDEHTDHVDFFPVDQEAPSLSRRKLGISVPNANCFNPVFSTCSDLLFTKPAHLKQTYKGHNFFQDVLLIIVFNYPYYHNVRYTEAAYRANFPNIAYCGPEANTFRKSAQDLGHDLTFIEASVEEGVVSYVCLIKVIESRFKVAGYLVTGEEALLNFWHFHGFNKDRIWTTTTNMFPVEIKQDSTEWPWWSTDYGRKAWVNTKTEISQSLVPPGVTSTTAWKETLQSNIRKLRIQTQAGSVLRGMADIYYIPARFAPDVSWYLTRCLKHRLFLEIAVPMTLFGLRNMEEIETIQGAYLSSEQRHQPWKFFDPRHHFLYPIKFSVEEHQKGFCSLFARSLLKHAPPSPLPRWI